MLAIAKSQKNRKKYECKMCDYVSFNKFDFEKHVITIKHINKQKSMESCDFSINLDKKSQEKKFTCENCNKEYKDNSGLWRHRKKCNIEETQCIEIDSEEYKSTQEVDELKDFMKYLMQENTEMKSMMMEVIKNGTHNTTNNNNNSHNKTFNLNMFLNETCKNAMNINDFVDSLHLQISDLEKVGEVGYIEGISSIIIKNLNALDVTERPIHCTDKKRETMYIRDEDKWEKDDEKKAKLHKMVKNVAFKNINLISEFQKLHPDWKKSTSKYSDQINKIIIESMGGKGDNEYEKEEKIIKRVAKEVFVDKN
jgi:hypothetical protein